MTWLLMATLVLAPLGEAIRFHGLKTPVVSALKSAEWERVDLGLRNSAQFSAGVENIRVVATVQRGIGEILAHNRNEFGALKDRSKFIAELGELAQREGLDTGGRGVTNLASERRAEMIYQMQTEQAFGYSRWKAGQSEGLLNAFPAQELIRVEERLKKRNWLARWQAAGGRLWGGRMIALKNDPVWTRISRFGNPWPPYDFGSGMGVEDVRHREAVALGLIQAGQRFEPAPEQDIDANLSADVSTWTREEKEKLETQFGEQINFKGGKAVWQGRRLKEFVADVLEEKPTYTASIWLGNASPRAVEMAGKHGVDLKDRRLIMDPSTIKHAWAGHGPKSGDAAPLTELDFELIPHIWREPDRILAGNRPGDLIFRKQLLGRTMIATWQTEGRSVVLKTMYKEIPQPPRSPNA